MTTSAAHSDAGARLPFAAYAQKVMSADDAVKLIHPNDTVAISGFASAGTPKDSITALAHRIGEARDAGDDFTINLLTGASVSPQTERLLAEVDGIALRMPYQSEPTARGRINTGSMDYVDVHLSHVAQQVWEGYYGTIDVAIIEIAGCTADGELIPSTSVGNNKTWLDVAEKVILEVNSCVPAQMKGMHDIYYGTALPPNRKPIMMTSVADRIGQPTYRVDPDKVVAIVQTHSRDHASPVTAPDEVSKAIAANVLKFFDDEVKAGRLPADKLLPMQAGIGNVANAVMASFDKSPYEALDCYTEVIQDGMLGLIKDGTVDHASTTSLALSDDGIEELIANIDFYRDHITLRPQEISNHPEIVRRLGVIAMNGMLEADIYGNVNSTHVMGTKMMNGIGGSGDFTRNGYVSIFLSPSTAKGGKISAIVPMSSHVDHTEHDVQVIVTEQGLADLRGLSPRKRARVIIDNCAHPDYRDALHDYLDRAEAKGGHTPHLLDEAFSFHERYEETGSMLP
ncbi:MAG TPA: acetyl-CoA hydrolase/transferase family protein [Gordonia sp. (in: high G+C Gram-positive bacteria)]|uniref:acetyl-CoA hydrolase/transferase family protein n=1 Tax=unclassified Gordonia (in: high G+C Gram-positive bacteria) TaxID=2657482 RepID=UPI000FA2B612|nr:MULTISPECIES: acetyl-CoA hydrolase/transferase family protein [unclassified Gordonia (in: high G+C Gram-positive bacteria)]RUP40516.1 MAG: acetyl-CoA hydrolase/transferase family protein [Gordonia sp. (in: high G+C Gram-positive bacteria)]HNP57564.1 acetyl-CoA hydrolase/transferase family protein [Gordonia sp. (in: high G+C Gram-positive bacteria)]HRC49601.1 acetyl-CoA hydrolase/transferase family protein [Gordonia sp. (in: high G+C Gram-positive bacteria)]